jgi:hypothetical protein
MPNLPDPRPARRLPPDHPLAAAVDALDKASWAGEDSRGHSLLLGALRKRLSQGDDATITSALDGAAPGAATRALVEALDSVINGAGDDRGETLLTRVFLLPVLFVTGGKAPARVSGVVPDVAAVTELLKQAGALGPVENFGLSNALGLHEAASSVSPSALHGVVRSLDAVAASGLLAPADLVVDSAEERVHLRYLAGASLTAADMPSFLERSGQVGRWGMALSQALGRQLGEEGLSLLPLPRAPRPWFTALEEGRFARAELAFNLFATAAIRRIRSETGDPEAEITARDDGTIRVDLTSPFDPMLRHAHAWPLAPGDDLARVELSILDLLRDCRVDKVTVQTDVRPAEPLAAPGAFDLTRH